MPTDFDMMRVLVVDDERIIADSLAMILNVRGFKARAVYDGEEAIAMAAEFDPQAIISDVVMPKINGLELAVYFAEHHPDCKVLLMSGNVGTALLLEQAEREGHLHTIHPKPVHPGTILDFLAATAPIA